MAYSAYQQTFMLSMASNLATGKLGTAEELQAALAQAIQAFLADPAIAAEMPGWSVSWGPCVWQAEHSRACDQAMVVFTNGATDVVAVAGTNITSWYDWLVEDGGVATKRPVRWPGAPAGTWISEGTMLGLESLLGMPFPPFQGPSLADFLRGRAGPDRSLIITGHSLAGALSPALALQLFTAGGLDRTAWQSVRVYPTAGYSPGNEPFAAFFAGLFPRQPAEGGTSYEVWNALVWNRLDVVPRAWELATMTSLPILYGYTLDWLAFSEVLLLQLGANRLSGPDYRQLQAQALSSEVSGTVRTLLDYLMQMAYQHGEAYFHLLGLSEQVKYVPAAAPVLPPRLTPRRSEAAAIAERLARFLS